MSLPLDILPMGLPIVWPGPHANDTTSMLVVILGIGLVCGLIFTNKLRIGQKLESPPEQRNGITSWIKRRILAWQFMVDGPRIIQDGFDKAQGKPFEIYAPENRYVFVSSKQHIMELDAAPDSVMSLHESAKQLLQPMYTMHGFNWVDGTRTEGVGFVRALRTLLTSNLPVILPDLSRLIKVQFDELRETHPVRQGRRHSPVYPMIVKLVVLANAVSFFGKDLAKNERFLEAALDYVEETVLLAEVVKLLPPFLAKIVGTTVGRRLKSQSIVFNTLLPIAQERCREADWKAAGHTVPTHADCIQWIMETSPKSRPRTPERVCHELMAIWFGSVHALATTITFAIHDLCLREEYVQPLRQELAAGYADFERTAKGLPLLDSFIKESARLTPVESMSMRRTALETFTFSDGTTVHPGEWACTPVRGLMQSPESCPEPLAFHGFRFADQKHVDALQDPENFGFRQPSPSQLTDAEHPWHVWGTGKITCPGRFYAVAVMKIVLGQIILNYNCELVEPDSPRWMVFRANILPKAKTAVVFSPLEQDA